ncbi:MAG TPA: hypothetical protein VM240_04970 [Verrucomicrobiae bacterium]|nr:hypothetical protein [Verrucomicrobiae bacterium]
MQRGPSIPLPRLGAGFTLVSAIFLMVVLVALGASMMTLSTVQHTTSAQMIQSVRANYAARAGVEWAFATTAGGCATGPHTLALAGSLSTFTVSVTCTRTDHDLGGTSHAYYTVDVTAQSGNYGSPDFVQRRVQSKLINP